jgi:digeranylgeranylglycerophospholipid reductase
MPHKYDLVIVGAGPGGAMAAKTAGENGLKTAILERKTNPAKITRTCAMMFALDDEWYLGERAYYNDEGKKMIFPVDGLTVDYDGPKRNFYAQHFYAPDGKTRLAFGDYEENIRKGDNGRLSFVYDKGKLIEGLMKDAEKNGVEVLTGVNVNGIEKTTGGVKVTGNGESYEATFVIGADGISSRIAQLMGFNKERKFYGSTPCLNYYLKGLNIPQPESFTFAPCYRPNLPFPIIFTSCPSPYAEDEYWTTFRTKEVFEYITQESIYSSWFPNVQVTRLECFVSSNWAPVSEPYRDNVLLVGDATWYNEAENNGSMRCGWKAANAVTVALRDNKPNREGVLNYIDWWNKAFPEFDDYRNFMMGIPFVTMFSEQEYIYMYNLIKKPLVSTLNPFSVVRLAKQALQPMMPQIKKEMPSIIEKLRLFEVDKIEEAVLNLRKSLKGKAKQ